MKRLASRSWFLCFALICLLAGCRPAAFPPNANTPTASPLLTAIKQNDRGETKRLIESRADLESRNESGRTPLALFALKGDAEMVTLLLEKGADIEAKDSSGLTPLMWGTFGSNPRVVQTLIDRGANVHAKDNNGGTALTWAQKPEIEALLKKAGASE